MKVCLSMCAKELPVAGDYYATASLEEEVLGQTTVLEGTTSPCWKSVMVVDSEAAAGKTLTVKVLQKDEKVVSSIQVAMNQLLEQRTVAMDGDGDAGSAVLAVHVEDYVLVPGTLQLQLEANGLENKERGLGFLRKSDPVYELNLNDSDSTVLYQSEVVHNDLCPKWHLANIDLEPLYAANQNLDSELSLVFWDQDKGAKRDLIGSTTVSIQKLLDTHHFKDPSGALKEALIVVKRAGLVGHGGSAASAEALQSLENAANTLVAKQSIDKCRQVVAQCVERAKALQQAADEKTRAAEQAAKETAQAKELVTQLEEKAKETEVASRTKPCEGSLQLQLACKDLANTDGIGLGIYNKSDPFFEIYGASGTAMYKSKVVEDNLNPTFPACTLDFCELTKGEFDSPIRIAFSDKDKGTNKNYLGQVVTTATALLTDGKKAPMPLTSSAGGAQGHMVVVAAELIGYNNLKELVEKLQKDVEMAYKSIPAQVKAEKLAAEEAKSAQADAVKAQEAADAAQKQLDAMLG